jgi:hypothetical protein
MRFSSLNSIPLAPGPSQVLSTLPTTRKKYFCPGAKILDDRAVPHLINVPNAGRMITSLSTGIMLPQIDETIRVVSDILAQTVPGVCRSPDARCTRTGHQLDGGVENFPSSGHPCRSRPSPRALAIMSMCFSQSGLPQPFFVSFFERNHSSRTTLESFLTKHSLYVSMAS